MTMKEKLIEKIQNKTLTMGVCGLGYVGLPLAVDKARHGFKTIGFDVQQEKVDLVNAGQNYIGDVVDAELAELVQSGMLSATTDFSRVCDVDFIAICVPTPLDAHQQPDISYVKNSTIEIAKYLKSGTMVVLESTTYPGTTEELLKPIFKDGRRVYDSPSIEEIRAYCKREIDRQWDEVKRFENPHTYYVDLSQKLWDIKDRLLKNKGKL